jgi:hypothetical protein
MHFQQLDFLLERKTNAKKLEKSENWVFYLEFRRHCDSFESSNELSHFDSVNVRISRIVNSDFADFREEFGVFKFGMIVGNRPTGEKRKEVQILLIGSLVVEVRSFAFFHIVNLLVKKLEPDANLTTSKPSARSTLFRTL